MADAPKKTLTSAERKARLPHGACTKVADQTGVDKSLVTKILYGEFFPRTDRGLRTMKRVQTALGKKMDLAQDEQAFPTPTIRERVEV